MRAAFKIIISLIVVIVLISSAYAVFFLNTDDGQDNNSNGDDNGNGDSNGNRDENGNGDGGDDDDENGNDDGGANGGNDNYEDGDTDQEYIHTVFIEEGTAGWCTNCPAVATILHELYKSGEYNFYYVTLIHDACIKAQQRLDNEYHIYGFPTVFIDGGYRVIAGDQAKSVFGNAISAASSRDVLHLHVDVTAEWNETTEQVETTVVVKNEDNETYAGQLKAYLTQKVSCWYDYDGNPYHFCFLDYIINEDITIASKDQVFLSDTWDASGVDPDNLMVIAVVFNSESTKKYADPPDNEQPFDAFYADATNATDVVEQGNLPPGVGIESPKKLRLHLFGNTIRTTFLKNTVLLGKTMIIAHAEDDSAIEQVEFQIKGRFREFNATIYEEPYEWTWHKLACGKYTITVTAYDDEGKTSSVSLDVIAFML